MPWIHQRSGAAARDGDPQALPAIPVYDLGAGGALELVRQAHGTALALLTEGRRQFTPLGMAIADRQGRRWLDRSGNPHATEIGAIAAAVGRRGVHALNLSYEWGCTCGVGADPAGGMRMLRALDWPFRGLGRFLAVARQAGVAGSWLNVTWPGLVGVYTGLAAGRFAAAINQPPLRRHVGLLPADWLVDRMRVWRSRALPPSHLLLRVFETCRTYAEAREALRTTPICLPALFTLCGTRPGEGCIIERTEDDAALHEQPAAIANDWLSDRFGRGTARGSDNPGRRALMQASLAEAESDSLAWAIPPIANAYTRVVAVANAHTGVLTLQGREADGPVTCVLRLSDNPPGGITTAGRDDGQLAMDVLR